MLSTCLTTHVSCRVWDDERFLNDDTFYITASERVDMKKNNQNVPYSRSTVSPPARTIFRAK